MDEFFDGVIVVIVIFVSIFMIGNYVGGIKKDKQFKECIERANEKTISK